MPWDCLDDEINAEFSAFVDDDQLEDELWRRHCVRSSRQRATSARATVGVITRTCEVCAAVLETGARGPLSLTCSERCKKARQRRLKRVPSNAPLGHGIEANLICPRHTEDSSDRDVGHRDVTA